MRVLITTPVLPPELGGPATFVPHFAAHLHARGHAVRVLGYSDEPAAGEAYPFPVTPVRRSFLPRRLASFFVECLRLARRADLVFACEHPAWPSLLAAKLSRRPLVQRMMVNTAWELCYRFGLTADDPDRFLVAAGGPLVEAIKRVERAALRRADLVVAVSNHLGETAAHLGVARERIFVSYNLPVPAASADISRAAARAGFGIGEEDFVLLVVARLVNWKRVDTVISAVAELPPRCRLVVVGEGPMEARLREQRDRLGLGERVTFAGRVDNDTARRYMRAADVLVLNSRYEGLSHVLLEAMAVGLPMAVSDVPGNRELVENGGAILLPAADGVAIAGCIEPLLRDPELSQRLRSRGLARAREIAAHHTLDRLTARLEAVSAGREAAGA